MAGQTTSADRNSSTGGDDVAELRAEVLRLRDLLIGKDAEIGMLRGRLAELEEGTARLLNLAARLRAHVPGPVRTAAAGVRKLRQPRS